ncbi:type I-E CRISPR-associated protein Cse1/CasA [Streptomyces gamaensis]|uniref:Type I-E CRISPR-associated protein Cse1/CasA n=1 Tax=Streptomyces gamaensis TaxID=1763542 RepID=A0ABW0YUY6_9ACTN
MRALTLDGTTVELSLKGLLEESEQLRMVSGTTPGEVIAFIEFLLGICYASKTYPPSTAEWERWIEKEQPLSAAASWLADQPDEQWNLFHPTQPLGQNALLAPFLSEHGTGPAQLVIEHAGDYNQFFDHHHLEHPAPLPAAAAFRAMLTQHVYGLSGRARISGKGTLGPTITNLATGRLGGRIRVLAQGRNLGETLRLNLAPSASPPGPLNLSWTTGDVKRRGFHTKPAGRAVQGPADLHSYLGRSVLLRPALVPNDKGKQDICVDRVLIGAGELLELGPEQHLQDAVFTTTREGKAKPLWPSGTRAFWREAHALYAAVTEKRQGLYGRLAGLPTVSQPRPHPYDLWAVGLVANKTSAVTWVSSAFPFAPGLGPVLYEASQRGSQIAEHVARSLDKAAYAAWEITYPNPKPADKQKQLARFDARDKHWQAAEEPFHLLLEEVADGEPMEECVRDYVRTLTTSAKHFLNKCLDSLPSNDRGHRARSAALHRFDGELTGPRAPADLQGTAS